MKWNHYSKPRAIAWMLSAIAVAVSNHVVYSQETEADDFDKTAIEAAVEHYFQGHATGDATHFRRAFLPTAHVEGIRDGKFTSWSLDEYCALFRGEPPADESTRKRTIDQIDANGNAAMVKATLRHGSRIFTDYFVLLKVDGAWRIANKVYYAEQAESSGR